MITEAAARRLRDESLELKRRVQQRLLRCVELGISEHRHQANTANTGTLLPQRDNLPSALTVIAPVNSSTALQFPVHEIFEKVRRAGESVPRYLFSVWHIASNGEDQLDVATQIVPRAFRDGRGPATMYDVPAHELVESIRTHPSNDKNLSISSSWSASIGSLDPWYSKPPGALLVVLDTSKLAPQNQVYWCGSGHLADVGVPYPEEYHVSGVVDGQAFQTVPAARVLSKYVEREYPPSSLNVRNDPAAWQNANLALAVRVGKLFNDVFALVVAVHLYSIYSPDVADATVVDGFLTAFDVSAADVADRRLEVKGSGDVSDATGETERANALLRALADRQARRWQLDEGENAKKGGELGWGGEGIGVVEREAVWGEPVEWEEPVEAEPIEEKTSEEGMNEEEMNKEPIEEEVNEEEPVEEETNEEEVVEESTWFRHYSQG